MKPTLSISLMMAMSLQMLACAGMSRTVEEDPSDDMLAPPPGMVEIIRYEAQTQKLLDATSQLMDMQGESDEMGRRLEVICADYPEHQVCSPLTEAKFALEAFCSDREFTAHVDDVVNSCHQGQCKQVDHAEFITRSQYMTLVQRLPHSLVTFRAGKTRLKNDDKGQLQAFVEQVNAEQGYMIIVGRASRDGSWRKNVKLALDRAENTRHYMVSQLGLDPQRVGYITYGHEKMYLTAMDAERLSTQKLSVKQANRSALVFAYPCFEEDRGARH